MVKRSNKNSTKKTKVKRRNANSSSTIKSTNVVDKATRVLKARHVESVCAEIESLRGPNGRIPRGAMAKVYEQNKAIYSWLTIDVIKKCLKKRKENPALVDRTIISDLTEDSSDPPPIDNPSNLPPPSSIGINNTGQNDSSDSCKKGGRPKGATIRASRDKVEQTEALIQEIASEWSEKVRAKSVENGRMKKNELEKFIEHKKEERGLTNISISKSCIRQRIQKKLFLPNIVVLLVPWLQWSNTSCL
jgi:hypothetical protein